MGCKPRMVCAGRSPTPLAVVLLLVALCPGLSTGSPASVREFRTPEGLAHDIVVDIVESPGGVVWFATLGGGISRYDGIDWKTFGRSTGLPSNYVWSLFSAGQDRMWAGTREGIAYFDGDEWCSVHVPIQDFATPWVYCITKVNGGALWFGADRGRILEFRPVETQADSVPEATDGTDTTRVPQGKWSVVLQGDLAKGSAVRDILQMNDGEIWAALSESGIGVYDGERWRCQWGGETAGRKVDSLLRIHDESVWAAGSGVDTLHRFDGRVWNDFSQPFTGSTCVAESLSGELFVGTREGLWIEREGNWEHPALSRDIPYPRVNAVSRLESGAMWIGTEYGAYRIGPTSWSLYERAADGVSLPGRALHSDSTTPPLTVDSQNRLLQLSGERWLPIGRLRPDDASCTAITRPHEGKIWVLFRDLAVQFSLERNAVLRSVPIPLEYGRNNLFQDRTGRLFLLSRTGVYELSSGRWLPRPADPSYHRRNVRNMVEDPQGALWVELDDAMERWDGKTITPFILPEESLHVRDRISAVHWGRNDSIWFGTTGSGLVEWDGESYRKHTARDGLLNDLVSHIYEASDSTLWVAAKSTGVSSYRDGRWVRYTHDDGLRGRSVRAICEDPKGAIWVALQNAGVACWRPTQKGPDTRIENYPNTMAPGEPGAFSFVGVDRWSQTLREDLAYSWRVIPQPGLSGDAVEWSPFTQKTRALTRVLQPGTYIFQVRVSDKDRNIDPTPDVCQFTVLPVWYRETGFMVLVSLGSLVILLLTGIAGYKHIRRRRAEEALRKLYHELEIRVKERTANLTAVNDLLEAEITVRKRAEMKFRTLYDSNSDAVMLLDRTGFFDCNPATLSMFGCATREGFCSLHPADVSPVLQPDSRDSMTAADAWIEKAMLEGRCRFEWVHKRQDTGEDFPAEVSLTAMELDGRRVLQATVRDIGERKKQDQEYKAILRTTRDGFWIVDAAGRFLDVNDAYCELVGYSREELLSMSIPDVEAQELPEDTARHIQRIVEIGFDRFETQHRHKDGHPIDVEVSTDYMADAKEFVVFLRDITERKRLEEQLQQSQKMEAVGTLAGGIAHDFNNILAAIIRYSELALGADQPPVGDVEHCLRRILESGERASELVKHILTFSRQGEQKREPVPIVSVTKEALRMLKATLPSTIEIRLEIACDGGALILGDATQIHQIILNLSTNALHAMGEAGGRLSVALSEESFESPQIHPAGTVDPGAYLKLSVSDTGHGMSRGVLARVLEPFFTTKATGKGTGMGLSVVHGIVKSHGGAIAIDSEPGEGTTVEILLPKHSGEVESGAAELPAPVGGNERILLVDDEEALTDVIKVYLNQLGYEVEARSSGFEALECFRSDPAGFDLVVTDQTMPQMTGGELAEEILRIPREIPVILCTGYSDVMSEEKARAMGIRAFMMKPVRFPELAETIRRLLDRT